MADAEEKAKAEKLAVAKKKVEEMKKKKAKKTTTATKKDEKPQPAALSTTEKDVPDVTTDAKPSDSSTTAKADEAPPEADSTPEATQTVADESKDDVPAPQHHRAPSVSASSKLRSASFRQASGKKTTSSTAPGPEADSAADIYRKQTSRIEELERDNKRLVAEVAEGERRWRKAEESLEDVRDGESSSGPGGASAAAKDTGEVDRLTAEIASLQRQNAQLTARSRHGSSPSMSASPVPSDLNAALASKTNTIEAMEIELSTLRAQLARVSSGSSMEKEQISALEEKLRRSERAAELSATELGDLKRNLERTTEKAVREGSEKMSAETRVRTLETDTAALIVAKAESDKRAEALEKKVLALTALHKEADARAQATKREMDGLRATIGTLQADNAALSEERDRAKRRSINEDDEGVDALEDEARAKLSRRIRELEAEVHDLRRGAYDRERRAMGEGGAASDTGGGFTDVDLRSSTGPSSSANGHGGRRKSTHGGGGGGGKGLGDLLASGFQAITGANAGADSGGGHIHDAAFASDNADLDDDDADFDEAAFRRAHEDEARRRLERVREVKRGLKTWAGWRMDLVEERRGGGVGGAGGGGGLGEIFEV